MAEAIPTLTSEGFVSAIDRKCDRALINLFASDASQSNVFLGRVYSIQDVIYRFSNNIPEVGREVARIIEIVLKTYFDDAFVTGRVSEIPDKPGHFDIAINGTVVENMRKYDFGRMVESANGMVQKLMTNTGSVLWQRF